MYCVHCKSDSCEIGSKYCSNCGKPLPPALDGVLQEAVPEKYGKAVCPKCHVRCNRSSNFCWNCGTSLKQTALESKPGPEATQLLHYQEDELQKVQTLLESGKIRESFAVLNQMLEDSPNSPKVHELLGDLYLKQEVITLALSEYKKTLELTPDREDLKKKCDRLVNSGSILNSIHEKQEEPLNEDFSDPNAGDSPLNP